MYGLIYYPHPPPIDWLPQQFEPPSPIAIILKPQLVITEANNSPVIWEQFYRR